MAFKIFPASGHSRAYYTALTALVLSLAATSAQAGFEWIPSSKKQDAPVVMPDAAPGAIPSPPSEDVLLPESPPPAISPQHVESQPITDMNSPPPVTAEPVMKVRQFGGPAEDMPPRRVILPEDAPEAARTSVPDSRSISGPTPIIEDNMPPPVPQRAAPVAQAPTAAQQAAPVDLQEVEGFGTDIPLALALRQVVPADYAYSFGEGVNPGYRVSWTGGKNWLEVVREMIAPLGLNASIQDKIVVIYNANLPPAAGEKRSEASAPDAAPQEKTNIYSLRRQAITNPGEESASQPPETLEMVGEIVASEMPEAVPVPDSSGRAAAARLTPEEKAAFVEPASGRAAVWEARRGDSLKRTLDAWSKKANVELVWESSHDYIVNADVLVNGDFRQALGIVANSGVKDGNMPQLTFMDAAKPGEFGKLVVQDTSSKG